MGLGDLLKKASDLADEASKKAAEMAEGARKAAQGVTQSVSDSVNEWNDERIRKNQEEEAEKAAAAKRAADVASGYYIDNGKLVISTTQGMETWLNNLGKDTTPSLMQTLQGQLQVLQTVSSSTMVGMSVDNMLLCLDKAVKASTDDQERANIRESFALMFQNFYFFQEANLRCAMMENKEESAELLRQAGSMLSKAVTKTAVTISGGSVDMSGVVVRNIFESEEVQSGYIKQLFSWLADKKIIQEKEKEFYKMIEDLFDTYDQYVGVMGPSIVSRGMLSRYRKELVERRRQKYTDDYVKRNSKMDSSHIENLAKGLSGIASGAFATGTGIAAPQGVSMIMSGVSSSLGALSNLAADMVNNSKKGLDIDAFAHLMDSIEHEMGELKPTISELEAERERLTTKLAEAGMLQFALKKEIQSQLDETKAALTQSKAVQQGLQQKLTEMKGICPDIKALLDEIKSYDAKLKTVEDKFAV